MHFFFRVAGVAALVLATSLARAESAGGDLLVGDGNLTSADCLIGSECDAPCDSCCEMCGDWCPLWTVQAGAVILHRSRPDESILLSGLPQLLGTDFDFGWAAGPDVSITRHLASGDSLELRHFGALDWEVDDSGSFGPATVAFSYRSRLHSTELNWRRPASECVTWLAGFRLIELHEDIDLSLSVPLVNINVDQNLNVDNHLYGGQIGADIAVWNRGGPLSIDGLVKAGVYGNFADSDFSIRINSSPAIGIRDDESDVAFVGELGIAGAYQLTDHWAARGGYQLLWIDRVALASDQFPAIADTSGHVFYHGALAGLELAW